jgi:hypothetical protein
VDLDLILSFFQRSKSWNFGNMKKQALKLIRPKVIKKQIGENFTLKQQFLLLL